MSSPQPTLIVALTRGAGLSSILNIEDVLFLRKSHGNWDGGESNVLRTLRQIIYVCIKNSMNFIAIVFSMGWSILNQSSISTGNLLC
jgi:hypothetical protein